MLRNIDPLLSPSLLYVLRSMGHGDEIAIVDANFPAAANARELVRADGSRATEVLRAILQVFPLDSYEVPAALSMSVVDDPEAVPSIVAEFQDTINEVADHPTTIAAIDRFAFYERAKHAYAIVSTGETRLYGNIIIKKGVVDPDAEGR